MVSRDCNKCTVILLIIFLIHFLMSLLKKIELPPAVLNALRRDSVFIFPTETLYGIGCSIRHKRAIEHVFEIKGRLPHQPPPVLFAGEEQLNELIEKIPSSAMPLMKRFWPGSLTLILPARTEIPDALCGFNAKHNKRTIGVRQTSHPLAKALCVALNSPIVATSANFSGEVGRAARPQTLADIPIALQKMVDVVVDGGAVGGAPSTIVDCSYNPPRLVREGAVTLAQLRSVSPVES
jgi:L-threonylcarbamoyladenylate synthase